MKPSWSTEKVLEVTIVTDPHAMRGNVRCACGGAVISNTGKIVGAGATGRLHCWACEESWDGLYAYAARVADHIVVLTRDGEREFLTGKVE